MGMGAFQLLYAAACRSIESTSIRRCKQLRWAWIQAAAVETGSMHNVALHPHARAALQVDLKIVRTAGYQTEVIDGFQVLRTDSAGATFRLYAHMTQCLQARTTDKAS